MGADLDTQLRLSVNFPSPPGVASHIIEIAQDPEIEMGKVAKAVSLDSALTTKILRIANSPLYAQRRKSENLRQALVVLGLNATLTLESSNANATAVNQVVPSPVSNLAFITYTGSTPGAQLPYYVPGSGANYIPLAGGSAITAPRVGAFTPDDKLFFVSTAGDNMIHYIDVPTLTDKQQISPNLPACTPVSAGGNDLGCTYSGPSSQTYVPATAIAVKPRSIT